MPGYLLLTASVLSLMSAIIARPAPPSRTTPSNGADRAKDRLAWFREARFGMFIHWGLYAVPAGAWNGQTDYGEWIMLQAKIPSDDYRKLADQFNPSHFDAEEWVRIAKESGMKYMVVTAKHHDGFSMYGTRQSEFNILKATPFKRDPLKELADACRKAGLKFCVYYSIPDWHHPDFPARHSQRGFHGNPNPRADLEKYVAYMKAQLRELLTEYGPIGILWFDGGGAFRESGDRAELIHAREIIDLVRDLQPDCLVNNRLGVPGDYGTPEQKIPGEAPESDFEVCMTLNRHWGYNAADHDWKSPKQIVRNLADIASKGGNYLLNVGPDARGVIPAESANTLREVGKWLAVNGVSIYGTAGFPVTPPWGRVARKGSRLYLHVFDWPSNGKLTLSGFSGHPREARLLKGATLLSVDRSPHDSITISVPAEPPDPIDSVISLDLQ